MKIIKRSGTEDTFDIKKIDAAIRKANDSVIDYEKLSEEKIRIILENVERACENMKRSPGVEEIQDMVENQIMSQRAFNVARNYITYRYRRELVRKSNSTDEQILSLLECNNEEVKQENSNKNPTVNSVQRDYMAGEVSKDITRRFLLAPDIVEAHEKGLIHFHDADYFAQHMHNCCLVNLEDMLQNRDQRDNDRPPEEFFHGLQYRDAGDRADCQLPVWRSEYFLIPSRAVCAGQQREVPQTGAHGARGVGH